MQTIEIKGHIYGYRQWDDKLQFSFSEYDMGGSWFKVREHRIVTEVPAGFDPRLAQVAALQEQLEKLRAEFGKRVTEINEQIQSLQALPFDGVQESGAVHAD